MVVAIAKVKGSEVNLESAAFDLLIVYQIVQIILQYENTWRNLAHEADYVVKLVGFLVTHFPIVLDVFHNLLCEIYRLNHTIQWCFNFMGEWLEHHISQLVYQALLMKFFVLSHLFHTEEYIQLPIPPNVLN